ncbi:MAG: hypothetical protein ACKOEO_05635 [Planctomycetaceae bacterium]
MNSPQSKRPSLARTTPLGLELRSDSLQNTAARSPAYPEPSSPVSGCDKDSAMHCCFRSTTFRGLCLLLVAAVALTSPAWGQTKTRDSKKSKDSSASPQQLEARISKAEEQLLDEYLSVANEYYKQGEREQSIVVLERIAQINPRMEGIRQRIQGIREELIQENGLKLDFDTSKQWLALAEVEEGKPFRLIAAGEYKLDLASSVSLTGLSTSDPAKDHLSNAPFGALVGLVFSENKPGDPFLINGSVEHTPKKSGTLYLRVNVPAAAKCRGDIKVQISGSVKPLAKGTKD